MRNAFAFLLMIFVFFSPSVSNAETWVAFLSTVDNCPTIKQYGCNPIYAIGWGFNSKEKAIEATINECNKRNGYYCDDWGRMMVIKLKCVSVFFGQGKGIIRGYVGGYGNTSKEAKQNAKKRSCPSYDKCRHVETRCAD